MIVHKADGISIIPASRSEAEAQAIQQNRAWPGILSNDKVQNNGSSKINLESNVPQDSRFHGNDKYFFNF